jgi:hypothetical protein
MNTLENVTDKLANFFSFRGASISDCDIPEIFPMSMDQKEYTNADVFNIYLKILTDTMARTFGLPDDQQTFLWDNCLKSESSDGLITMLARAMTDKQDLFVVYDSGIGVLRRATSGESQQIKDDYAKQGESTVGVYISFKSYARTDLVKFYSALEYLTIASLNKSMNLSKAVQIKLADMRASVSLADSDSAKAQARTVATALSEGRDVVLDAKDH